MATNLRNIGEDQRWSTRGREIMETNQQNHQTGIQSTTNRTSPESEQYICTNFMRCMKEKHLMCVNNYFYIIFTSYENVCIAIKCL